MREYRFDRETNRKINTLNRLADRENATIKAQGSQLAILYSQRRYRVFQYSMITHNWFNVKTESSLKRATEYCFNAITK